MTKEAAYDHLSQRKLMMYVVTIGPGPRPSQFQARASLPVKKLRLYTKQIQELVQDCETKSDRPVKLSSPLRLIKTNLDRCSYAVDARFCVFECVKRSPFQVPL